MHLNCPICVGSGFDQLATLPFLLDEVLRENVVLGCQTCGHVMVDLRLVDDELIQALYAKPLCERIWSPDGALPYDDMVDFAAPELRALMESNPQAVIADFGYGQGQVLEILRDRIGVASGYLAGYDFRAEPVDGVVTHDVRLDLLDEHDAGGMEFDFAFCCHVLEHIHEPRRLLRGLRKNARPGAYFYLETPDHTLLTTDVLSGSNMVCAQHLHYFSVGRLATLATSCGWTVVRQEVSAFGYEPRARLLLRATDVGDVRSSLRGFLAHREGQSEQLAQSLLHASTAAPVAAWGVGTDLTVAVSCNADLAQRISDGRVVLFDRDRAGAELAGQLVQDSAGLNHFGGTIILTARAALTRVAMLKLSVRLGFGDKVVDPYSTDSEAILR